MFNCLGANANRIVYHKQILMMAIFTGNFMTDVHLHNSLTSYINPCIIQPALSRQAMLGQYLVSQFPNFPAQLPVQGLRKHTSGFGQNGNLRGEVKLGGAL